MHKINKTPFHINPADCRCAVYFKLQIFLDRVVEFPKNTRDFIHNFIFLIHLFTYRKQRNCTYCLFAVGLYFKIKDFFVVAFFDNLL